MKRVLIYAGLVGCGVFVLQAKEGRAEEMAGACPSVTQDICRRVDLSEVCGPGCYVDLMGDRQTDE